MVTSKKASLKAALEGKRAKTHNTPAPAAPAEANGARAYRGAVVSGYFDKKVQMTLRMLSISEETTVQKLLAEAINLLFEKRKMPQIADTTPSQAA